jgi:hypothetical protein
MNASSSRSQPLYNSSGRGVARETRLERVICFDLSASFLRSISNTVIKIRPFSRTPSRTHIKKLVWDGVLVLEEIISCL